MINARVSIPRHDDKGLSNLVCTILHCIYGKRGQAGVLDQSKAGLELQFLHFNPSFGFFFGNGTVLCIKDLDGGTKVSPLLVLTAFGLQI